MIPDLALKRVISLALALNSESEDQFREDIFLCVFPGARVQLPVTNLAALLLIFSRFSISVVLWGSQTLHPYSRVGLTKVLKHLSLTLFGQLWRLRCKNARVELAFLHSALRCVFQLSLLSTIGTQINVGLRLLIF